MGFPHCPICVSLAFFAFCVVFTRSFMFFFLLKGTLKLNPNFRPLINT